MLTGRTTRWWIAAISLLAFVAQLEASPRRPLRDPASSFRPAKFVYFEGNLVQWQPEPAAKRQTLLHAGPWLIGPRTKDKPRDGRLNLYIVAPGTQRHDDKIPGWDHNLIINALPREEGAAVDWDVYLAIVLDPSLKDDIRTERQLILARQQSFMPGDDFKFNEIPGVDFLRQFLKFESVSDLEGFRRSDGTLPRLVLVPVRSVIRAAVMPDEAESAEAQANASNEHSASEKKSKDESNTSPPQASDKDTRPPQ